MTAIVLWGIRILVLMLVVRYVLQTVFGRSRVPVRRPSTAPIERVGGPLVRCAKCGTYVPEAGAITTRRSAGVEHFCSATCRDAWTQAMGADV